jgi:hypothetical protein
MYIIEFHVLLSLATNLIIAIFSLWNFVSSSIKLLHELENLRIPHPNFSYLAN